MQLRFSVLLRDRAFSKAMRRMRPKLQPLLDAFAAAELENPIHEGILVGITDEKESGRIEEVENSDGFFQVLAGCKMRGGDAELTEDVIAILRDTVSRCPFARSDHDKLLELFDRHRPVD